jgi:hypothetical protein
MNTRGDNGVVFWWSGYPLTGAAGSVVATLPDARSANVRCAADRGGAATGRITSRARKARS